MSWFPVLLVIHVSLAVALLAPSVVLPFLLRGSGSAAAARAIPLARLLLAMQGTGSLVVAVGLAVTGIGLLLVLGMELLSQPWLLVALTIYAANLVVAAFVARPNLRRLLRLSEADDATWRRRARRQRWIAYAMAAATGVIGLLMSTKPELW
ncbi:MAG TPA: DUF2269 family protein [Candidatus Limnocylindria bacterium]|nr:DUF2269 family protein [Candidatus Limnocylindria bacterium]